MTTALELAELCEASTQDERELDAKIAASVRYHPCGPSHWLGDADIEIRATGNLVQAFRNTGESCASYQPPPYTSSIDAAITLLPKGSLWSVRDMEDGPYAQVIRPMPGGGYINGLTTAKAATVRLAICAAALRGQALSVKDQTGGAA